MFFLFLGTKWSWKMNHGDPDARIWYLSPMIKEPSPNMAIATDFITMSCIFSSAEIYMKFAKKWLVRFNTKIWSLFVCWSPLPII